MDVLKMLGLVSKKRHDREVMACEKAITRLEKGVEELTVRLFYSVEGVSPSERQILNTKKLGKYIYTVTVGVKLFVVEVPIASKNHDKDAKILALKKFGYSTANIRNAIKGCKATRWTL